MRHLVTSGMALAALLCGCTASRPGRVHRFRGCRPAVEANLVLCNGAEVARIECHGRYADVCRALAVRYSDGNVAWLYSAPWFDPDRPESAFEQDHPYDFVSQVTVTRDAAFLWYRLDEEKSTRWIEYDVEGGMQRPVSRFYIVQLSEGRYRGDVFQVSLLDPARDEPSGPGQDEPR
ncbi:MAG TPA: hypothetical protein VE620_07035 [Myxococcales bacterium]|jgi:hypothetical protein|nr:hypothetical protein [Myxococcales bacterium]